ncbi:MAG: hypothetical protein AABX88_00955 [Nanoarchaeota archaeon]
MPRKPNDNTKNKTLEKAIEFWGGSELLRECIKKEKGEIVINWEKIKQEEMDKYSQIGLKNQVWNVLLDIGLLSGNTKGNYMLESRGMSLNPSMRYFTREKDVMDYKKTFFNGVNYPISVFKGID